MKHRKFIFALTAISCGAFFLSACALKTLPSAGDKQKGKEIKDNVVMVLITGGTFDMGSTEGDPDERPVHTVFINDFYMDIHEVTNRQYEKFLLETGRSEPPFWYPEYDRPDDPVIGVSWHDAVAYAECAGKRLPTEAEWEYAARGGADYRNYYWGEEADMRYANYKSFGIAPVKSFLPNNYGLYDIIGNVWEWCSDWYDGDYYNESPMKNPKGPLAGIHRVLRGGAWYCDEKQIRISNRFYSTKESRTYDFGFRCVK